VLGRKLIASSTTLWAQAIEVRVYAALSSVLRWCVLEIR
jgi:hypothetical protein